MFQIASEISDQALKRKLSSIFAKILAKNPDATPEILNGLKAQGLEDKHSEVVEVPASPSIMKDPTSPLGFIELIWTKLREENIVQAT